MPHIHDTQYSELRFHGWGLSLAGFILPNRRKPSLKRIIWCLSYHIPNICIHILAVLEFLLKPYQVRRTLVTIILLANGLQTTFRPAHMIYKKKQVEQLIADFEISPNFKSEEFRKKEKEMKFASRKKIIKISSLFYFYNALLCIVTLVGPIIRTIKVAYCEDKRQLNLDFCAQESTPVYLYDFWWFTDPFKTPTFYFLYLYNCAMVLIYILIFCTSDAFTCSTIVALAERGDFLVKMAPIALIPGDKGSLTPIFTDWIQCHQHYKKLLKMVNEVMGPIILITHALAAVNIMGYLYLVIKDDQEGLIATVISFLIVTAIQFFFYAYWGQQVITKNEELSRAVFNVNQVVSGAFQEGTARSTLMVLMARCCGAKVEEITGLGYFTVSLRFYARIISLSATYLLVFLQFSKREAIRNGINP